MEAFLTGPMWKNSAQGYRDMALLPIDVTVGSGTGPLALLVRPEWSWVTGLKTGKLSWDGYKERYLARLEQNKADILATWAGMQTAAAENNVSLILLCYCRDINRCHRLLLAQWLQANGGGVYLGDR